MKVSKAYQSFGQEAPAVHKAWMETVYTLEKESALDKKTKELAYLAVLAATRLDSGLPAVGNVVIQSLPTALEAYDESLE